MYCTRAWVPLYDIVWWCGVVWCVTPSARDCSEIRVMSSSRMSERAATIDDLRRMIDRPARGHLRGSGGGDDDE